MKELQLGKLRYLINYPDGFAAGDKCPVLLFLHGAGSRGDDIEKLITNPFFKITDRHKEFPFVVVAPLCSENTWFDMWEHLEDLVKEIAKAPFTDKKRIYVIGASMGGYATWQLGMSMPEYFAAMVPVCGGGMYWNAARLAGVPVWAFHGAKDTTVFMEESVKMVEAVKSCGGNAQLTVYPENGHDAWSDTYANWKVFSWMLEHTNSKVSDFCDKYNNAEIYG